MRTIGKHGGRLGLLYFFSLFVMCIGSTFLYTPRFMHIIEVKWMWLYISLFLIGGILIVQNFLRRVVCIPTGLLFTSFYAFCILLLCRNIYSGEKIEDMGVQITCLIIAFIFFRHILRTCSVVSIINLLLLCCFSQAIYGLLQFFGIFPCSPNFRMTGSFDNPAGLAVYISIAFPLCIYRFSISKNIHKRIILLCLLFFAIVLILLESRTAILSVFCYIIFEGIIKYGKIIPRKWKYRFIVGITCFIVSLIFLLYHLKKDSADGRLLIWQCTMNMITDNPVWGYGSKGFQAEYMNYQAEFLKQQKNSPNAMLADQINHPFNEYLLVAVCYGIIGLSCLTLMLVGIILLAIPISTKEKQLAAGILLVIAVSAFFSYPLQYPFTWLIGVFAVAVLSLTARTTKVSSHWWLKIASILVITFFACYLKQIRAVYEFRQLADRMFYNHSEKSTFKMKKLYTELKQDAGFLYTYGAELLLQKKYEESLSILQKCEEIDNSYELQLLLAECYSQISDLKKEEQCLLLASDMCPARFIPLYKLFKLYSNSKQTDKAKYIAKEILEKPVKVSSPEIQRIKESMAYIVKRNSW